MKHTLSEERRPLLELAAAQLKLEFAGLDDVINQLISAVTPWFILPDWHNRPVIVNLWGMTGTGKTSLVSRLTELLQIDKDTYHIQASGHILNEVFQTVKNGRNGQKIVFVLDEFQIFRTIDEEGHETGLARNSNVLWKLLDSGIWQAVDYNYSIPHMQFIHAGMQYALDAGVVVREGKVVGGRDIFVSQFDDEWVDRGEDLWFLSQQNWSSIAELTRYRFKTYQKWQDFARTHSAEEQVNAVYEMLQNAIQPEIIDCSKALIFVIGNLDEAYAGSNIMQRHLQADAIYQSTRTITMEQVKDALRLRFRTEQISRLGNTHILYPALREEDFRWIISSQLKQVAQHVQDRNVGLVIQFDDSVHQFLYEEGVYPAQGVRPLLSTIQHVLWHAISQYVIRVDHLSTSALVRWDAMESVFVFDSMEGVYKHPYTPERNKRKEREIYTGDKQLICVHEAGHVMGMICLQGVFPDHVYNNTFYGRQTALVLLEETPRMLTLDALINQVAVLLGGWVAEGIVFGEENRTTGSEQDLHQAHELLSNGLRIAGLDGEVFVWRAEQDKTANSNYLLDKEGLTEKRLRTLMQMAVERMENCLQINEQLFMDFAAAIEKNAYLNKVQLQRIYMSEQAVLPLQGEELAAEKREQRYAAWQNRQITINKINAT